MLGNAIKSKLAAVYVTMEKLLYALWMIYMVRGNWSFSVKLYFVPLVVCGDS